MKLPAHLVVILGVIAGLLEVVNRVVLSASPTARTVISVILMFAVGVGLVPVTGEAIRRLIPLHVAVALTSAAGVLQILQQEYLGGGAVLHAVVGDVLFVLAAVGLAPGIITSRFARG